MKFDYDEDKIDQLILAIYTGLVSAYHLPKGLYTATADYLKDALYKGFGGTLADFTVGTKDWQLIKELRDNVYMFSGAKTFTQVLDIKSLMYEGNTQMDFRKFKSVAKEQFLLYQTPKGEGYIESEYITAQTSATSALNWSQAKSSKKFVKLKTVAIIDSNTSPICIKANGLTAPIDDPVWNTLKSPRHWRCRCHEEIIDEYDNDPSTPTTEKKEIEKFAEDKMQDVFKMNPGKDGYVFKEKGKGKHPYFQVGKEYRGLAKYNFNLPIPDRD